MTLHRREIHGHEIAYRTAGEGPAVVLVHGMAGSSATWDAVLPGLAEHFTVVAPDLLGHGESAKPADADYSLGAFASNVRDLMLALGHERATVAGQSLGGGVAMQFAYQFPDRCERLVLVSSGGLGREVTPLLRALAVPGVEYLLPVAFTSITRDVGRNVASLLGRVGFHASPQIGEILRSYESLADPATRSAFVRTLRSVIDVGGQQVSAQNRLHLAADVPTLIVWGEHDRIIPVSHAYTAHDAIPNSRVEVFEETGHFPHREAPDRFARVLSEFIHSTRPATLSAAALQMARATGR